MPLINVHLATGRTPEQKRAFMHALTEAAVAELGASRESVRVWLSEFEPDEFMAAGELLSERRARTGA